MQKTLRRIAIALLVSLFMVTGAVPALVQAATPTIAPLSPTSGPPGTVITVNGSSFNGTEAAIAVTYDGTTMVTVPPVISTATGNWSATFVVPSSASGSHVVVANGVLSANTTFTVTPVISISALGGAAGTPVTVSGSGFGAGETGITVTYAGVSSVTVASAITASALGVWTAPAFTVPVSAGGSHAFHASGALSTSVPDVYFSVTSGITLSRTSGAAGSSVTVTGSGFGAGETGITVTYDGTNVASATASALGAWTASFVVPASLAGAHVVHASGSSSIAADVTFSVTPSISISPVTGVAGRSVTVTGYAFAAGETDIKIIYDGAAVTTVPAAITASAQGGWTATFTVPVSAAGAHVVDASGANTQATVVPDVTFTVTPGLTVNRASGTPGAPITVTGTSFGAGEPGISVTYDGAALTPPISVTASPTGGWTATFNVPASAAGPHVIDASGSVTTAAAVPDLTFTATPSIKIDRSSGTAGESITVTGSGFGAEETGISVSYDNKTVTSGVTANARGTWTSTFNTPQSAAGAHSITAKGSVTPAAGISEAGFTVGAGISLDPSSGHVGSVLQVTGSGFAVNSPVKFTYDDQGIVAASKSADGTGSFGQSITVPKSVAGTHIVKVVDGDGNTGKANFTISDTPPPTPTPRSPADGAVIGILGNVSPTLEWSAADDPNGVTYSVQVDTFPDFSSPLVNKKDISGTHYALSSSEALPRGEYYWRVKAVNGASIAGEWSQPRLLKSGFMPLWVLLLIIGLVVGAAAYVVYALLLRQKAGRPRPAAVPEAEAPQVVQGEWRMIETEEANAARRLPWRLALPEAPKGMKTVSAEDQARLKVIVDFAQSLPLVEPNYEVNWIIDLAQAGAGGAEVSPQLYQQLLKGELEVRYEPAWMNHPIYEDLTALLEGQPILEDLNTFVEAVDGCSTEAISLFQNIYTDVAAEITTDFLGAGGWRFVSTVYSDALSWFLGKSLREPSEREYVIKSESGGGEDKGVRWLCGVDASPFAGQLIQASDEAEAVRFRVLHLKLRRAYRSNEKAKLLASMITQVEVQRSRLASSFSQLGRITR